MSSLGLQRVRIQKRLIPLLPYLVVGMLLVLVNLLVFVGQQRAVYGVEVALLLVNVGNLLLLIALWRWNTHRLNLHAQAKDQRAAEVLHDMQTRYLGILESAMDAIITVDEAQRIVLFNNAAERLFQYPAQAVIGQPLDMLIPRRFIDQHRRHVQRFGNTGISNRRMGALGGISGLRADGQEFPIEASISQVVVEQQRYFTVILRDVTERVQFERDLHDSAERFRRAITRAPIPILIHDESDHILLISEGWTKYSGYDAEDLQTIDDWTRLAYGPRGALIKSYINEVFEQDATLSNGEWLITAKDGEERVWDFYTTPLISGRDGKRELLSIAVDVTERKQAEAALRALNTELEARVAERTQHLAALNRELEAFSYSVSHDLRSPLRAMDGYSQALQEDYGDKIDADGRYLLERIRASSQRMGQLIDDLLKLARLSREPLTRKAVNLSLLADEILAELRAADPQRSVTCVVEANLIATGDPRLLHVLLTNLLHNAWKFSSKNPSAEIRFGAARDAAGIELHYYVRDNGAGFDMAYAHQLFGVFQRLHAAHEFEGTGVGLATVQRIINRHGGRIWAEGVVGEGAVFYFVL